MADDGQFLYISLHYASVNPEIPAKTFFGSSPACVHARVCISCPHNISIKIIISFALVFILFINICR